MTLDVLEVLQVRIFSEFHLVDFRGNNGYTNEDRLLLSTVEL